jgi:hypothetical protein
LNTELRERALRRFNNLYRTYRMIFPTVDLKDWTLARFGTRDTLMLRHDELEELCDHMEHALRAYQERLA